MSYSATPLLFPFFLLIFFSCATAQGRGKVLYRIHFSFNWTPERDKSYPIRLTSQEVGFTPLICASHNPSYAIWQDATILSPAMRTLLRDGDSSGIVRELKRKMKAKNDRSVYEFKAAATDSRPISERTLDISVNGSGGFNNISCVAKIFPSPDFFVGLQPMGINLYNAADGFFVAEHTGDLIGRDGGIDRSSDYEGKDPVPDEETLKIRPLVIISAPYGTYKIVAITPSPQPGIPVPTIMSTNPPAEPSTTSAICVDANALAHLPRHRLRYLNHMMAPVLCDASGSCATPGHMVIFRETAMMMHSYCALVPCSTRTILVNSPRYSRAVRLSTRTHALYFTAFAARYVTHTEENMFALAVRIGL